MRPLRMSPVTGLGRSFPSVHLGNFNPLTELIYMDYQVAKLFFYYFYFLSRLKIKMNARITTEDAKINV